MNIQETGVRGYLKWLQADQPGIYAAVAPHLAQQIPEAFSDYEQSQAMGSLMGFGEAGAGTTTLFDSTDPFGNPATIFGPVSHDVATAANSGTSSPSIVSMISNLVGAAGQVFLAKSQVDNLKKMNDIQLQRAQAGQPPLDMSSYALGIPQVNVGLSSGTIKSGGVALAVVAGLSLLFALTGKRKGR